MIKLIIRDDDCNFFTNPDDLDYVYRSIPDFPITYAVVPMVTDVLGGCPETKDNSLPRFVGENKRLVEYLKTKLREDKCDVVLHGVTHGYQFDNKGKKIPEMIWRNDDPMIIDTIGNCKSRLENLFNHPINCFVAPSNHIQKKGIRAVYSNGLNYSGIISASFNRDFSLRSLVNYIHRWYVRFFYGFPYPGMMDYGTHLEVNATNRISYYALLKIFRYCLKHNLPMAINVHYWHIRDNQNCYKGFFDFINYALDNGAIPTRLSEYLDNLNRHKH